MSYTAVAKSPENRRFAKLLHQKYIESGLSNNQLADMLGISHPMLSHVFKGKRGVSLSVAIRISNIVGIDLGELQKEFKARPQKIKTRHYTRTKIIEFKKGH